MKNRVPEKQIKTVNPDIPQREILNEQFSEALRFTKASLNAFPCAASSFSDSSTAFDERNKNNPGN